MEGYRKEIDDTNKKITDTKNKFVELTTLINAKDVQVPKITTESGGQTISVSDATKNILDEIFSLLHYQDGHHKLSLFHLYKAE